MNELQVDDDAIRNEIDGCWTRHIALFDYNATYDRVLNRYSAYVLRWVEEKMLRK